MAVLETIRNKFGILITVLIAVALLSFIIDPTSLASLTGGQQMGEDIEVASINGKSVTYTDFNNEVQKLGKGNEVLVFQNFINKYLYIPTAKNAGFNVSDKEMYNLLSGNADYPSFFIYSQFQGQMNPELLVKMEEKAENDPSGATKIAWDNAKENVEAERYMNKYSEYLSKSFFSNSLLMEEETKAANNLFNVEFVTLPYNESDPEIVVSEEEIKDYYNAHKNLFSDIAETRNIEYVVVEYDIEDEDTVYEQVDSVFNNINGVESLIKVAVDNGYSHNAETVPMLKNTLGEIENVENIIKWAFKESSADVVSEIYPIENEGKHYFIIAGLSQINPKGSLNHEEVVTEINRVLRHEKAADKLFAEVASKVNGMTDLNEIAEALATTVSRTENLTFASSDDLDKKLIGALSVAETGVVSAPLKGSNGVYVYKVTDRTEGSHFIESDFMDKMAKYQAEYNNLLQKILGKKVENNLYLYL